jgi:hypothetical protein
VVVVVGGGVNSGADGVKGGSTGEF